MLGSHNSFSYINPIELLQRFLIPWSKCQSLDIEEQYKCGVRYFDIRINYIKGSWFIVHNKNIYSSVLCLKDLAANFNSFKDNIFLRVIYDKRKLPKEANNMIQLFMAFLLGFTNILNSNIKIDSATTFWDWKEHLNPKIKVKEYHASVMFKWYRYILGTKWFAKHYNNKAVTMYKDYLVDPNKTLLLDYVQL